MGRSSRYRMGRIRFLSTCKVGRKTTNRSMPARSVRPISRHAREPDICARPSPDLARTESRIWRVAHTFAIRIAESHSWATAMSGRHSQFLSHGLVSHGSSIAALLREDHLSLLFRFTWAQPFQNETGLLPEALSERVRIPSCRIFDHKKVRVTFSGTHCAACFFRISGKVLG